ncbi:hypothetical protein EHN06_08955 [Marinobacter sp. NP-4(2019)]|uniref:hypothetical protein n=1 Tax=Marinobacter sp. NP-4(2019) TaxID=2488665 RepID=UPI000FC3D170|nr:hypothetical protein [Marinobacter sp. NP-4(2019)]AZT83657.1 hypothetical protein EHN06_08955 [Marinobacter sp. NP-4(2019)]
MPEKSTLRRFERLATKFSDDEFICFGLPVKKPTSFRYKVSANVADASKNNNYNEILHVEMPGVISSPDEFEECCCDFVINCPYKSSDIEDGYLGFGMYEAAINRFSFWIRISSYSTGNVVNKWSLENALGSDVTTIFGKEFWSVISVKTVNFRLGHSVLSDGELVIFDIIDVSF